MNKTIEIDNILKTSEENRSDKKAAIKNSRKLTLTRPGESKAAQDDSTDIATAMAATLCHEINNPLMTISAITEVLLSNHKKLSPDIIEKIKLIAVSTERIKDATHKLISLDSLQYCETAATKMILTDNSDTKSNDRLRSLIPETSE